MSKPAATKGLCGRLGRRLGVITTLFTLPLLCGASEVQPQATLEWGACATDALTAKHFVCGTLRVPESWDQKGSTAVVQLPFAIRRGTADRAISVAFLIGGPGGTNVGFAPLIVPSFDTIENDIVFLERRGAGYSVPSLACPPGVRQDDQWSYPDVTACAQDLRSRGIALDAYGTAAAVADLEALRGLLGVKQWRLFSVSYGTRMALEVLRRYPDSVQAAVLDSVYPGDIDPFAESAANHIAALEKFLRICAADTACNAAYPDLRDTMLQTERALSEKPLQVLGQPLDGAAFVRFLADNLEESYWIPRLPLVISLLNKRDTPALEKLFAPPPEAAENAAIVPVEKHRARGLWLSVECSERMGFPPPQASDASHDAWPTQFRERFVSGWTTDDRKACAAWNIAPAPDSTRQPVTSSVPVLMFAGDLDPVTPMAWAEHAAATLSNARVVSVPRAGHAIAQEPCPMSIARAFYADPRAPLDTRCVWGVQPSFQTAQ